MNSEMLKKQRAELLAGIAQREAEIRELRRIVSAMTQALERLAEPRERLAELSGSRQAVSDARPRPGQRRAYTLDYRRPEVIEPLSPCADRKEKRMYGNAVAREAARIIDESNRPLSSAEIYAVHSQRSHLSRGDFWRILRNRAQVGGLITMMDRGFWVADRQLPEHSNFSPRG